ncbi:MAG TPA: hypothetical protein VKY37_06310 [Brumimicrobium sp.]|nr:hypothetical protein [Brumimicrobium sp.]
MKKSLMILTIGLFLGTVSLSSTAMTTDVQHVEKSECNDKEGCTKKDCCKKKSEAKAEEVKTTEAKACASKEGKKACCSKGKSEKKD